MKHYYFYLISFFFIAGVQDTYANVPTSFINSSITQNSEKVLFVNGYLKIQGIENIRAVEIYDILGKNIYRNKNVVGKHMLDLAVNLKSKSIYIVKVLTTSETKSFKIVAL